MHQIIDDPWINHRLCIQFVVESNARLCEYCSMFDRDILSWSMNNIFRTMLGRTRMHIKLDVISNDFFNGIHHWTQVHINVKLSSCYLLRMSKDLAVRSLMLVESVGEHRWMLRARTKNGDDNELSSRLFSLEKFIWKTIIIVVIGLVALRIFSTTILKSSDYDRTRNNADRGIQWTMYLLCSNGTSPINIEFVIGYVYTRLIDVLLDYVSYQSCTSFDSIVRCLYCKF
jgi:hypothetical protein